jgi:hypothetical protein
MVVLLLALMRCSVDEDLGRVESAPFIGSWVSDTIRTKTTTIMIDSAIYHTAYTYEITDKTLERTTIYQSASYRDTNVVVTDEKYMINCTDWYATDSFIVAKNCVTGIGQTIDSTKIEYMLVNKESTELWVFANLYSPQEKVWFKCKKQ